MDHGRIGRSIRVVRVRRRIRQVDLAALVGLSQQTISRIERGRIGGVTVDTLEGVFAELGIRTNLQTWWDGAELDRLLAGRHSAMHDEIARMFEALPEWVIAPEVSFAIYGERGVIDILAWHAASRTLLVIELKTELVDVQETVGTLDRKRRLAAQVAAERGWKPAAVSVWLVIADGRTNERRVGAHHAMLRAAYPVDGRTVRRWLQAPSGTIAALSFLPSTRGTSANREFARVRRVSRRRLSVDSPR
jgi:transcriptional regulator with XRE-family HTH domain